MERERVRDGKKDSKRAMERVQDRVGKRERWIANQRARERDG